MSILQAHEQKFVVFCLLKEKKLIIRRVSYFWVLFGQVVTLQFENQYKHGNDGKLR